MALGAKDRDGVTWKQGRSARPRLAALENRRMSRASDPWYVRFPDGRVMRASSTAALRHHLETGRIPTDSRVRRSPDDEWTALDWMSEFSDLAPQRPARGPGSRGLLPREPAGSAADGGARANHMHLQTVGVRGLVEELLAAMDSALVRSKLIIAALAGVGCGLAFAVAAFAQHWVDWPVLPWVLAGLVCVVFVAWCAALLTQMTFVEVSQLRPARWAEATTALGLAFLRLVIALLLVGGITIVALGLLRATPTWATDLTSSGEWELWPGALVTALALVLQVVLWPLLGFILLLAPVILIEERSLIRSLAIWTSLLWRHLSRVILYEALALSLAGIAALPFILPVALSVESAPRTGILGAVADAVLVLLAGVALTPLLAYLPVANVFIFLTLRYEHSPHAVK